MPTLLDQAAARLVQAREDLDNLNNWADAEDAARTARVLAQRAIDQLEQTAQRDGRPTASAQRDINAARQILVDAAEIERLAGDVPRAELAARRAAAEDAREGAQRAAARYGLGGGSRVTGGSWGGGGSGVYVAGGEHSFFRDLAMAERGDYGARERLDAHARAGGRPEQRAASTGTLAGLVPPAYLADLFAQASRASGVFVGLLEDMPLPAEGMTIMIPRSVTPTIVSSQTQENAQVPTRDVTADDLTVPIRTIAGAVDLSWQAMDRGHMVDRLVFADLAAAWIAEHDRQALAGPGTAGQHLGVLSTTDIATVTVSATSVLGQWRQLGGAIGQLNAARLAPPTAVVMHPRRWAAWSTATDSQGRPLFDTTGDGQNTLAVGAAAAVDTQVGRVHGVPVYSDPSLPIDLSGTWATDPIIVTRASDVLAWTEGSPRTFRFDDVGSSTLTARLIIAGYAAFSAGWKPTATIVCSGTGLVAPTFT